MEEIGKSVEYSRLKTKLSCIQSKVTADIRKETTASSWKYRYRASMNRFTADKARSETWT